MFSTVFFISFIVSQNIFVICRPADENKPAVVDKIYNVQEKMAMRFPKGIVEYVIDPDKYDSIISKRIKKAMDQIEAYSCIVFKEMSVIPSSVFSGSWVHFTNPSDKRDCVHQPISGDNGEIIIEIGFDCMTSIKILHSVLHAIGFKDEVTHPHRDQYLKVLWENIQPGYRPLYHIQEEEEPYKVVEYDPMSVMHFHDTAYSMNGGRTIVSRIPGLAIAPSTRLSVLDVMKLRLWFGHECNKRKIGALLDKCKVVLANSPMTLAGHKKKVDDRSVSGDDYKSSDDDDDDDSDDSDDSNGSGNAKRRGSSDDDSDDSDDANGSGNAKRRGSSDDDSDDSDDSNGSGNAKRRGSSDDDSDDANGSGNAKRKGSSSSSSSSSSAMSSDTD